MGYGGTGYATVRVDIVQTDVDAIVQGITGTYGRTLTDLDNDLGRYLYYAGTSVVEYIGLITSNTSYLSNIDYGISSMKDCLYDYDGYQSAAALLADIRDLLQRFSFDGSGRLKVITT